jgi:hypothetical protein
MIIQKSILKIRMKCPVKFNLAQDTDQWWFLVMKVKKFEASKYARITELRYQVLLLVRHLFHEISDISCLRLCLSGNIVVTCLCSIIKLGIEAVSTELLLRVVLISVTQNLYALRFQD